MTTSGLRDHGHHALTALVAEVIGSQTLKKRTVSGKRGGNIHFVLIMHELNLKNRLPLLFLFYSRKAPKNAEDCRKHE